MDHRVALVRHAHFGQSPAARELEPVPNDPMYPSVRIDVFLNRDLLVRVCAHPAAGADIESFRIFTKHDEVDVVAGAVFQGTEPIIEQTDGPVVHIQIKLESSAEQNVASVAVIGYARIAKRADE